MVSAHGRGRVCWVRSPELELRDTWVSLGLDQEGEGPSSAPGGWSCHKRRKSFLCLSCILLPYPSLCVIGCPTAPSCHVLVGIPTDPNPLFAEPTSLKERNAAHPPSPQGSSLPKWSPTHIHKTSLIFSAVRQWIFFWIFFQFTSISSYNSLTVDVLFTPTPYSCQDVLSQLQ